MSTKARQALNSAIVTGNMNYNVQLYAKILLESQVQSTAQHLRINEVNYESGTARHMVRSDSFWHLTRTYS